MYRVFVIKIVTSRAIDIAARLMVRSLFGPISRSGRSVAGARNTIARTEPLEGRARRKELIDQLKTLAWPLLLLVVLLAVELSAKRSADPNMIGCMY